VQTSTLAAVNDFGIISAVQSKIAEVEEIYIRALRGHEKVWEAGHIHRY
jgi:hypothetical protein